MQKPRLFLSHSWKDKFFANKLAEQLAARGVEVWVDSAELKVGDSLFQSISKAIADNDHFAIILSHNSVSSNWVQRELRLAMNLVLEKKNRRILPILIERCEIPLFLRDLVYADFTDPRNFDSALVRVLGSLGIEFKTSVVSSPGPAKPEQKIARLKEATTPGALGSFEDIHIVEVNKARTYKPDEESALYNVYLKLSAVPPAEWTEIFDAEREFPRHSMWRRAWIESDYVIVHCVPEEMKQYHLRDLKQDVASSNAKYREYLMRVERQRVSDAQRLDKEKRMLDDTLDGLEL
jgi:TIR domain